jgi:hypothetical protein
MPNNMFRGARRSLGQALLIAVSAMAPAGATTIADPAGDFLPTYTGATAADLDWLSASAVRRSAGLELSATVAGDIGGSANAVYVWGINRGAGTARFAGGSPGIGADLKFDSVVALFPSGEVRVVLFGAGPPSITILPTLAEIEGASIGTFVPWALLPENGFATQSFRYHLWTRNRLVPGIDSGNFEVADFIAYVGGFKANVPEPSTWALMIAGFGVVGAAVRRRRAVAVES